VSRPVLALGLMSGTSMDGIDVALLETDGRGTARPLGGRTFPYPEAFRKRLAAAVRAVTPAAPEARALARELTDRHAEAVEAFLAGRPEGHRRIEVVGFHGHTLRHRPRLGETVQLGCGARLARRLGLPVVSDFRSEDVRRGGQGAPLVPLYHACLLAHRPPPQAVLNLGGIANLTWIGPGGALRAGDVAPCNALLDDWVRRHTGLPFDRDGEVTLRGRADPARVAAVLAHPFFARPPPRSLDRLDFDTDFLTGLDLADGLATAAALVAEATARLLAVLPAPPRRLWLTGGGRRNRGLVRALARRLAVPVAPVEALGRDGDLLEAEAFAYLAVRVCRGLPTSLPETTGVVEPVRGGVLHRPESEGAHAGGPHRLAHGEEGGDRQDQERPGPGPEPGLDGEPEEQPGGE